MVSRDDINVLRRLGERKAAAAAQACNKERRELWRSVNSLRPSRPAVWINELPWRELESLYDDLKPVCQDPWLRSVETLLRRELRQWESFPCDMVADPFIVCPVVGGPESSYADYGIVEKRVQVEGANDVQYLPVIDDVSDADAIRTPRVWFDKAETERRLDILNSIFDGVLPVKRRGIVHQWHAPWDQMIHWYGVERLYCDMYERPELVERTVSNFCKALSEVLDAQERLGLLDAGDGNWRVGSGGMGIVDGLPESAGPGGASPKDQWGCSNAQIFSEVSPEMHWEFSLKHELPIISRFGLSYYGCCEPLHLKLGILRRIPNLRKISAAPKADLGKLAEEAKLDYALSWKPNPAIFVNGGFGPDAVKRQVGEALEKAKGCCLEIILKDVSTLGGDPRRLEVWAAAAMDAAGA